MSSNSKGNGRSLKKYNPLTNENSAFYIMMLPFILLFFLFTVLPVLSSVGLSLFEYDMISLPKWHGFNNYLRMFVEDEVFPKTILNTLKFAVFTGPVSFLLAFILAWFICELR